jgi:hypothetical protein
VRRGCVLRDGSDVSDALGEPVPVRGSRSKSPQARRGGETGPSGQRQNDAAAALGALDRRTPENPGQRREVGCMDEARRRRFAAAKWGTFFRHTTCCRSHGPRKRSWCRVCARVERRDARSRAGASSSLGVKERTSHFPGAISRAGNGSAWRWPRAGVQPCMFWRTSPPAVGSRSRRELIDLC